MLDREPWRFGNDENTRVRWPFDPESMRPSSPGVVDEDEVPLVVGHEDSPELRHRQQSIVVGRSKPAGRSGVEHVVSTGLETRGEFGRHIVVQVEGGQPNLTT